MRQLSFMLIRPEKQRKSTPWFLKMELLTKVSACKSFSNKASLGLLVLRMVFHPVPCRRKGGKKPKHFSLSALPCRAALADARLPKPLPPSLLSSSWLYNAKRVGLLVFPPPPASDCCDHSKKSRQNGWNHHLLKDVITSCALNSKIHLAGRIGFYISLSWSETAASTCPGSSLSGRRGPRWRKAVGRGVV